MSFLRNITKGLRSLFRKEQVDRELDEELRAYQEMAAEEKMKNEMSRKESRSPLGAWKPRSEQGNRSLWRLGILCGIESRGAKLFDGGSPPWPMLSRKMRWLPKDYCGTPA